MLNNLVNKSVTLEINYPYTGQQGQCRKNFTRETFTITGHTNNFYLGGVEARLMNLVRNFGPAVVAVSFCKTLILQNF